MKTKIQLTNRMLSFALALIMVLGMLPITGFTASAATTKRTTKLSLSVTSGNSKNEAEGWSWVKGADAWTLTLNNVNIEVANDVAVYLDTSSNEEPRNVNIVLNGDNRIVSTKPSFEGDISSLGIKVMNSKAAVPNVTFSGDGTLLIKGQSSGIWSGSDITFDNAHVTVEGGYYGGINLEAGSGNLLTIKNNSVVNVNHSTDDGNAYGKAAINSSYGDITVENSTLNVSAASNGSSLTLVKAHKTISVSNSTLALNVTGNGDAWRWGTAASTISISDSTVNATNISNSVVGGANDNAVTMTNVNGTFLSTGNVANNSATMQNCNIYHGSRYGTVTIYGNATLPDSVSEITGQLSFKNSTDSLTIPSGKSLTFSGTPRAGEGTIINNGSLVINSPDTFYGSYCTLSGTGEFLLKTEATADCIVVPNDLVYTGDILLTEDTDKIYLQDPQATAVTILGVAFQRRLLDKANWILSLDRTVRDAGTYTARFTNNGKTISKTFSVSKAPAHSVSTPTAQNSITYGVKLSEVGLPSGWTWADSTIIPTVNNNGYVAYYTPNDANYDWTQVEGWNAAESRVERTISVTVNKATSGVTSPTAKTDLVYNGSEQELISAGSAVGGELQYSLDGVSYSTAIPKATNANTYTVYYKVVGDSNHSDIKAEKLSVTIGKATYDMTGAKWDYDEAIKYDDKVHTVYVDESSLPEGVTVSHYTGNTASDVGKYTANVSLNYDYDNYYEPVFNYLLDWEIVNNWTPTEYTVSTPNDKGWINEDFVIKAADGYKVSFTNTADGEWSDSLIYSEEADNGSVTFYLKNITDDTISLGKPVTYKLDKTPTTGNVTFTDAKTIWDKILESISFGIYVNTDQKVVVTTGSDLSGVAKVEYYETKDILDLAGVQALDNSRWTEMANNSVTVSAEDAKQFIYYIRITDNAGNVTYLSTNGAEFDLTSPVISGIINGKTYYTTQKVTVTDKNIESITLNGATAGADITLGGNKKATYTILVTDKAGNSTTVTVTMKPISELSAPIDTLNKGNVNSSNEGVVDVVKAAVAAVDTTNATEEEKAALKEITDKAAELEKVIDDTKTEIARINEELNKFDGDTVNSDDAAALEQLGKDIKALTDGGNLTDAEREALTEDASMVAAMQKTVADTVAENDRISDAVDGYDLATVTSDDKADLEQLLADIEKQLESTNLTEEEISELNGNKKAVEDLLTKIKGTDELIDKLTEDVDGYNDDTVKSTDKDAIEQIIEDIDALLETENLTEDEKKALEDAKEKAAGLLDTIKDAAEATDTENTEKVKDVTSETVTPENKTDLEKAKDDLEKALEDKEGNYTEDEKKAIEDEIKRIEEALDVIGNVEAVEELINKLPDTIKKDDEAAIKAADDAYNALSDYEKSLVDKDAKKTLDDAKAALAELNKPVTDPNSPQTGDNSHMALWIALLFISGGAVITLTVYDRKRRTANR